MSKTTCEEWADRIVDYVDGELPPDQAQAVAAHLSQCDRCRQTAAALQRSLGLVRLLWQENLAEVTTVRGDAGDSRSMGVPPMSSTAVPAVNPADIPSASLGTGLTVAAPEIHGRDAHGTHGQDAHATVCPDGHTTNLARRRSTYALAVAASILLVAGGSFLWVFHQTPPRTPVALEEVQHQVARAGVAAELLAATRLVAQCEGTESIVQRQYRYILSEYAGTPAAESIKASHNLNLGGTQHE
jgi:anti-sigma factor RsiW